MVCYLVQHVKLLWALTGKGSVRGTLSKPRVGIGHYSPCVSICTYDDDEGYCLGCYRTKEEISGWRQMTNEEQLASIEMLRKRSQKAKAGQ